MIQLKVYKQGTQNLPNTDWLDPANTLFIDLYDTEPIKLTLSIEDITQADATSVFSKTFRVPATRDNNEFFQNAFEIDGINYDVTIKNPAQILVDGAEFRVGHIRLQKIYINDDLDKIDYELLFLGETRDFSSTISDKTLCQIVMTDFDWQSEYGLPVTYTNAADFNPAGGYSYADQTGSWQAYPQSMLITDGFAGGDILFPLIDHGNSYDDQGDPEQPRIALGANATGSFTSNQNPLDLSRLKPMFRAKRVWDQIFEDAGYTYQSDFLNSDRFHQMYISAFGNNESVGMTVGQTTGTNFESSGTAPGINDVYSRMYNPTVISNVSGHFNVGTSDVGSGGTGSWFVCPQTASAASYYIMEASALMNAEFENSNGPNTYINARIELVALQVGQSPGGIIDQVLATGNYTSNMGLSSLNWDSRNGGYQPVAGQILQVVCESPGPVDYSEVDNTYWACTAAPGDYYAPLDLDCEYKQIDYIKDVLTMFRLVMQPDNKRPNNFIIEPWQDFIGSGTTYNWSDKLIQDKDMVFEPLFNTQSDEIEFSKTEDEDYINEFHQDNNKHPYGWLRFDSGNELLKGTRKVEVTGIAPTPLDQIEHGDATNPQINPQFVIPSIHTHDDNTAANEHIPIKPKTRFLFYNGLQLITVAADKWYMLNDSSVATQQTYWPLVSSYEDWPVQQTSLNLNFSNDTRYYITPNPGLGYFEQGSTLFDEYWSRYISSLYGKFSRRLTARFVLSNVDLQDLTFDDIIFVNGKYYRPEKIIDATVGETSIATVQLITLNDQRPIWLDEPLTGFSVAVSNNNCIGEDGEIQITTNGTPPFTWELTQSGTTGTANPSGTAPFIFTISAPVGIDTLVVTDAMGRIAQVQVDVPTSQATAVTATSVNVDPTDCNAPCNGSITVTGAGGVGPYTITWSDGFGALTRNGLCPGQYSYFLEDANGCPSDAYVVDLTCNTPVYYYELREHLNNCSQLSAQQYYAASTIPLTNQDTVSLNERNGCYQVLGETEFQTQYTVNQDYADCASCNPGNPSNSWEVQICDGTTTTYIDYDVALNPGDVVTIDDPSLPGCWTVLNTDSTTSSVLHDQVYEDCTACNQGLVYYAYACDGSFMPTYFTSVTQKNVGSVYEVTSGIHIGKCVEVIKGSNLDGQYDTLGAQEYVDCDDCQGTTPPPQDTCHTINNAGSTNANGTYTFNQASYLWKCKPGQTISMCAEVGSVVAINTNINVTITNTGNPCTSPSECSIPPSPGFKYVVEDCETQLQYTMDTLGTNFQVGDVIQYQQGALGGGAIYCGEIVSIIESITEDARLYNQFVSYFCGDTIHCLQ